MRKLCLCIGIGTVLLGTMSQDVFCTPIEEMSAVAESTGMRELQHNVGATSVAIHTMQELDAREQSLTERGKDILKRDRRLKLRSEDLSFNLLFELCASIFKKIFHSNVSAEETANKAVQELSETAQERKRKLDSFEQSLNERAYYLVAHEHEVIKGDKYLPFKLCASFFKKIFHNNVSAEEIAGETIQATDEELKELESREQTLYEREEAMRRLEAELHARWPRLVREWKKDDQSTLWKKDDQSTLKNPSAVEEDGPTRLLFETRKPQVSFWRCPVLSILITGFVMLRLGCFDDLHECKWFK